MTSTPRHAHRLLLSLLASGGLVVGAVLSAAPGGGTGTVQSWRPGEGGIPAADVTAFGAVIR